MIKNGLDYNMYSVLQMDIRVQNFVKSQRDDTFFFFFSCISWNMSMFKGHAPIIAVGSDDSNSTGPKVLVYEFSETGRRWIRVESIMTINDAVSEELF